MKKLPSRKLMVTNSDGAMQTTCLRSEQGWGTGTLVSDLFPDPCSLLTRSGYGTVLL